MSDELAGIRDCRPPRIIDSERRVDLGAIVLAWMPDEYDVHPGRPWVEHRCLNGADDPVLIAAALHHEHSVTEDTEGRVTIMPSVLCHVCGLHGWVTNSEWVPTG